MRKIVLKKYVIVCLLLAFVAGVLWLGFSYPEVSTQTTQVEISNEKLFAR